MDISSFAKWQPKQYLNNYYSHVEQDEVYTLEFLVEAFKEIKTFPTALDFGSGPTLHHVLPLSPYVSEIHVADYLEENLKEIQAWQTGAPNSHNWNPFTELILKYENKGFISPVDIQEREILTRSKLTKYLFCDAYSINPLGTTSLYPVVLSCYCADSITSSKEEWYKCMKNIISIVLPGGYFVTTALRNCRYYKVGDYYFPSANINETDMYDLFSKLDFDMNTVSIIVKDVPEHEHIGYNSIVFALGYKNK